MVAPDPGSAIQSSDTKKTCVTDCKISFWSNIDVREKQSASNSQPNMEPGFDRTGGDKRHDSLRQEDRAVVAQCRMISLLMLCL